MICSRHLFLIALSLGTVAASALPVSAKLFTNQNIVVKADPGPPPPGGLEEIFTFDLLTEDTPTTVAKPGYPNPGTVTPTDPSNPGATRTDSNPLLTSEPYTFTGYKILQVLNGKVYKGGVYAGDIRYRETAPYAGTNAEDVGVFNYAANGDYPTDLFAHALPDDLWNPGGEGLGFSSTPSLPSTALDNYVSFGGFAFDVFDAGTSTFDEPYQIFTVSRQPTQGNFTGFVPGDYAGCPGSCRGADVNVPGPLPIFGVGAAFGFSRRLRKRICASKAPGVMSAID